MKGKREKKVWRLLLFFVLVLHGAIILFPMLLTVADSFMSQAEIDIHYGILFSSDPVQNARHLKIKLIPLMVSFSQYARVLFQSPDYLYKFWNSVIYTVPIVLLQVTVSLLAAYSFSRFPGKYKEFLLLAYILLMLMPNQVTMVPNYLVCKWLGILDTRWAIWMPGISAPFSVYFLTKGMRKIPANIYEAARIDGAGEWKIFTGISLPLCRGTVVSVAILVFMDYWNMVEQPILMLSDQTLHPLSVFLSKIAESESGLAFAAAVVYMVCPICIFLYGEEELEEGFYVGTVKG